MSAQPFNEGDIVRIKGEDHLGLHVVDCCEWYDRRWPNSGDGYWLCQCSQIREPIDWSKYAPGTTGIVAGSFWRGSSEHLEPAAACQASGLPDDRSHVEEQPGGSVNQSDHGTSGDAGHE